MFGIRKHYWQCLRVAVVTSHLHSCYGQICLHLAYYTFPSITLTNKPPGLEKYVLVVSNVRCNLQIQALRYLWPIYFNYFMWKSLSFPNSIATLFNQNSAAGTKPDRFKHVGFLSDCLSYFLDQMLIFFAISLGDKSVELFHKWWLPVAYAENFHGGGILSVAHGGHLYLVRAVCHVTIWRHVHVSRPTFWRSLLTKYAYSSIHTSFRCMCHCTKYNYQPSRLWYRR